ncbi:hypothetical protein J3Q64DRAFT_1735191 [Phycomyces blakesleeanus]|uniref:Uncharacterized protein n=1 Tax=Phycomyces blakesleeanus TaxID=4837 RepID=A0ABR3B2Y4_PHYBL
MLDWLSTWLSPQEQKQQQQETYRHGLDQYEEDGDWIQVSPVPKEPQQLQPVPKEAILDDIPKDPISIKSPGPEPSNKKETSSENNDSSSSAKHLSRQERRYQARMALKEKKLQTRPTPCRPNATVNHCLSSTRTMSIEC